MISWRALLDEAQPLAIGTVDDEFLDRAVSGLRGVKLHVHGPHKFRFPGHVDQLGSVRSALEAAAQVSPEDAHLLHAVLRRPVRVYPLAASPHRYALVGAWRIEDRIEPRIVIVSADGTGVDPNAYPVGEAHEDLLAAMEQLYTEMDPVARDAPDPSRAKTDRVLWIGGSDAETGDPTWRTRVAAVLMTDGFAAVIRELPGRDPVATARAISEMSGAAIVSWVPRLGSATLAGTIPARSHLRVIALNEYDFGDALDELRMVLEAEPVVAPTTAAEETSPGQEFESGGPYYFKKIAKRGRGVDLVIHRREPCSHESWTVLHGAPQARKGIETYSGRTIRKLEHCDRCTGGGMWRVSFD